MRLRRTRFSRMRKRRSLASGGASPRFRPLAAVKRRNALFRRRVRHGLSFHAPAAAHRAADLPRGARSPARARRPLHRREDPVRLAAAGAVQLGARLVRRRARDRRDGREDRAEGRRRQQGRDPQLRRARPQLRQPRQRPALDRGEARRPAPDDARRDAGAVGDDAGGDEARPRADSGDAAALARRHRRPARARPGEVPGRARGRRREVRRDRGEGRSASRSAMRPKAGGRSPRS